MFSINYKAKNFSEIVGHNKIISEFKRRSTDLSFPEVMFFMGEPGSGKTAVASIIAKLINCKSPVKNKEGYFDPCDTCPSCLAINSETFGRDTYLFNASQMGKEEVLKLEDLVSYFPSWDKNIVILIDEAHELRSVSAKGATKKLLEKKRQNVFFILCTSDKDAFTPEIKRRGQVYLFNQIDSTSIADYLVTIIQKEGLFETIPEEFLTKGVFTIAEGSGGSPGYAISLLERCLSGQIYTETEIVKELGLISEQKAVNILADLLQKKPSVFEELKSLDLKDFYFKSNKILTELYIYKTFGFIDQEWKLKNISTLNGDVWELIKAFNSIQTDPFFKETSFYFEILNYFKPNIPTMTSLEKPKRIPVNK